MPVPQENSVLQELRRLSFPTGRGGTDWVIIPGSQKKNFPPVVIPGEGGSVKKIVICDFSPESAGSSGFTENPDIQPQTRNVATLFTQRLAPYRENLLSDQLSQEREEAFIRTNERAHGGFFEDVRNLNPDGYFIGVGVGNALSVLVNCFSEDNWPKGVVLIDRSPRVIAFGKMLINQLAHRVYPNYFANSFLRTERQFRGRIQRVIDQEADDVLKQKLEKITEEEWHEAWEIIDNQCLSPSWYEQTGHPHIFGEEEIIDPLAQILVNFPFLRKLALAGNIAIVHADFTDPGLIQVIRSLPHFKDTTPVIYMSGIVDHTTDYGQNPQNASAMDPLRMYEVGEEPPIFIEDTAATDYYFRMTRTLPSYT